MYKSIDTVSQFRDEFRAHGRADQFSYDALGLLFDYLESIDYQELDVIELCCAYSEESVEAVAESYRVDIEGMSDEEALEEVLDYLNYHTSVVGVTDDGGIVYSSEF
tara:strand:- start:96 stop:416 length:321 start_codon:yes stop_codon:yes gene_type:complete